VDKYKNVLDSAVREVLGPCLYAKKPWISQGTLSIIDQCRKAMQLGDLDKYRRLARPWRSLRHDKQQWAEQITYSGEACGEIKNSLAKSVN